MTIDRQQLTELLAEKSTLGKEQVEEQLSELIKQIRDTAKDGKSFEVEDFGTFSMKDDEIQFTPVERLETEINNKYAGMKPIELIGAFKEPEAGKIPDMDTETSDETVWAFDEETDHSEEKKKIDEGTKANSPDEIEITEPAASNEAQEEFEELIDQDSKKSAFQPAETPAAPEEPEQAQQTTKTQDAPEGKKPVERDPIGRVLVAAVVVIALGIAGLLAYDSGFWAGDNSTEKSVVSTNDLAVSPQKSADREDGPVQTASAGGNSEPEASNEVINSSTGSKNPEQSKTNTQQKETFGLKGMVNPQASDGYTIVVHSLRDQKLAESKKQNFKNDGYRALINEAEIDGTAYFRVGLGQFTTIAAAQKAVSSIPAQFQGKSMHFIKRIQ